MKNIQSTSGLPMFLKANPEAGCQYRKCEVGRKRTWYYGVNISRVVLASFEDADANVWVFGKTSSNDKPSGATTDDNVVKYSRRRHDKRKSLSRMNLNDEMSWRYRCSTYGMR